MERCKHKCLSGTRSGEFGYRSDMFSFHEHIEPIEPNEIIMSWACGVTPQTVALSSKIPFMISHCPGHMFVTDKLSEELAVL